MTNHVSKDETFMNQGAVVSEVSENQRIQEGVTEVSENQRIATEGKTSEPDTSDDED